MASVKNYRHGSENGCICSVSLACDFLLVYRQLIKSDMPKTSLLRFSFNVASLILARRSLQNARTDDERRQSLGGMASHMEVEQEDFSSRSNESNLAAEASRLEVVVTQFAVLVLQTLLELPNVQAPGLQSFHLICISYSILIISQYSHALSIISDHALQTLLLALRDHPATTKMSKALTFATERAIQGVKIRLEKLQLVNLIDSSSMGKSVRDSTLRTGSETIPIDRLRNQGQSSANNLEAMLSADMESLDGFFGGGFVDFGFWPDNQN